MTDIWLVSTLLTKWALYIGVLGASGGVLCAFIFGLQRLSALVLCFAFLGCLAAILSFALKGAALTGDLLGMTDPEMLWLLWSTSSGTALILQIGGLFLIALGAVMGGRGRFVSLIGALTALGSLITTGHIVDLESLRLISVLAVHLVCAAFWIGIFAPLGQLLADAARYQEAAALGQSFGRLASIAVPALILAGMVMAYTLTDSTKALFGSAYGQTLMLKTVLVAGLLALAAINKFRLVPRLQAGNEQSARHLQTSLRIEGMLVLFILAITAALTSSLTLPQ